MPAMQLERWGRAGDQGEAMVVRQVGAVELEGGGDMELKGNPCQSPRQRVTHDARASPSPAQPSRGWHLKWH
jgi:hypothetical protein